MGGNDYLTRYWSNACAGDRVGINSIRLQPKLELPDSAQRELAEGSARDGGECILATRRASDA